MSTQIDRITGLVGNLGVKAPCNCASVGALTLVGEQTVDGYACTAADNGGMGTRVLYKDDPNPVLNGIYYCNTGAWQRAPDFDGQRDVAQGTRVFVTGVAGVSTNVSIDFEVTTTNPVNVGTSGITFASYLATSYAPVINAAPAKNPLAAADKFGIWDSITGLLKSFSWANLQAQILALFSAPSGSSLIGYQPAGTGSVARTQASKNSDVVSVKDFGAKGDGVTDDSSAIRLAVTAVTANGGSVYLPTGSYLVTTALGDTSNTAIYVPSNVRIYGSSQAGTVIVPGANNVVVLRFTGLNAVIENLQINNTANYTGVSGISLAPVDETQLITHTDVEFNEAKNISIKNVAEGITLRCGPTVGAQDSYCYYNTFTTIDIRNSLRGIWLKVPNSATGSGCNRNRFVGIRIGETGTNTGIQIDAGNANTFVATSLEGILTGTAPNAIPTGLKVANNSISYDSGLNKFYGLTIEAVTRSIDNNNPILELYGYVAVPNTYYSASGFPLAVNMTDGNVAGLLLGTGRNPTVTGDFYAPTGNNAVVRAQSNGGAAEMRVDSSGNYGYFTYYQAGVLQWTLGNIGTGAQLVTLFDSAGTAKFVINSTTGDVYPALSASSNLGKATNQWLHTFSGDIQLSGAAPIAGSGVVAIGGTTATTVGAAGAASALPAAPVGYLIINVAGTQMKIPYYNT